MPLAVLDGGTRQGSVLACNSYQAISRVENSAVAFDLLVLMLGSKTEFHTEGLVSDLAGNGEKDTSSSLQIW